MKTSIKTLLLAAIISLFCIHESSAQIVQISSTKLPAQARTTIRNAWNGAPIVNAWRNKEGRRVEYKASVEDGSTIKFNANGQWIEMKNYAGVPTKMLPHQLLAHIDKYYEGQLIVWVSKTPKRYRIELANGTKLEFNNKGVFQAFL
ncbi:MAG: PepSY-like domain-containing protein [Bacteroidales bacterium]|nr:PepSY-like domain-containing protein [Bacteroidales bacterium]